MVGKRTFAECFLIWWAADLPASKLLPVTKADVFLKLGVLSGVRRLVLSQPPPAAALSKLLNLPIRSPMLPGAEHTT